MIESPDTDRILTIPNLISFVRLIAVGVFWWVLLGLDDIGLAAVLIFVIGGTDWIDGYLARRLDQVSRLGKALDPVADRLMIFSAVAGGLIVGVIPALVGWLLVVREVLISVVALWVFLRGGGALEVRYLGKLATFLLYGAIPGFYLAAADIASWILRPAAWIAAVAGLVLYWYVGLLYVADARQTVIGLESGAVSEEV